MGKGCIILIFSELINESTLHIYIYMYMGFPGGAVVKNPPVNAGMQFLSLGGEDPLEKRMATHSSILVWEIPWIVEPVRLPSMGPQELGMTERLKQQTTILYVCVCI